MAEFMTWGRRTRGWATSTCDGYRRRTASWLNWCTDNNVRAARADVHHLEAWLDTLHPTASVRCHAHTAALAYYDYLVAQRRCRRNPVREIPRLPSRRVVPRSLEPDAVRAVLSAAQAHGTRWAAFIGFLAFAGLRRAEACGLRWVDIEGHDEWIRVLGKGQQEAVLPIHDKLRPLIVRWRSEHADVQWIFPGLYGAMSVATATVHTRAILDAAGLPHVTGHWLRHSYARRMVELGAPLPDVMGALRHSSLSSTTIYTRARPANLVAAVAMVDF